LELVPRPIERPLVAPPHPGGESLGTIDGLKAFLGGIGFIVISPSVWVYSLVPIAMFLMVMAVFSTLGFWGIEQLRRALVDESSSTWAHVGSWLLAVFLWLITFFTAIILALVTAQPLSGFALERIAHVQERKLTGETRPRPNFFVSLWSTTKVVAVALSVGVPIFTAFFIIDLAFPPATVVTVPLRVLVSGWLLAWDFVDYPLGLRGLGLGARFRWVGRNFEAFTTFGLLWALIIFVPGVVLLLLPMGVAGATRLVVADDRAQGFGKDLIIESVPHG
jgi:CysZ protein